MFPKVGDIVRLNPDFLKIWFKRGNGYLKEEVWKEDLTITEVRDLRNEFSIDFESKNSKYNLYVLSNGEFSTYREYKGIQVFIPVNNKNDIYCLCGGPKKENCVLGKKFYVCAVCKKEVV